MDQGNIRAMSEQSSVFKNGWQIFGSPVRGRSCGSCTSCCTWVPVERPLNKPAGVACRHVGSKGCRIHPTRPDVCRYWNCAWLYQAETAAMKRPDHAGYLIDPMPQTLMVENTPWPVLQVWVDPERPHAHRDPALRDYLNEMGRQHQMPALIRWAHPTPQEGAESMLLVPPSMRTDNQWHEQRQAMVTHERMAELLAEHRAKSSTS